MKKMLGTVPSAAQIHEQIESFDEHEVDRVEAIVRSMTPQEREDVSILGSSRRVRITHSSGTSVADVSDLVKCFEATKEMMSQMGQTGGVMPGFGSIPGRGGRTKQKASARKAKADRAKVKKKARSDNPVKCRQQELEALLPRGQYRASVPGASFGAPTQGTQRPSMDDPPDDVKRMFQGLQ